MIDISYTCFYSIPCYVTHMRTRSYPGTGDALESCRTKSCKWRELKKKFGSTKRAYHMSGSEMFKWGFKAINTFHQSISMTLFRRPVICFTSSSLRPLIETLFQHRHYQHPPWDETSISSLHARSKGFTAVTTSVKNTVFWDMASCSLIYISRRYEGMHCLHIHSLRVIILQRRLFFSSAQFVAARYIFLRPVLI